MAAGRMYCRVLAENQEKVSEGRYGAVPAFNDILDKVVDTVGNERYVFTREDAQMVVKKLVTFHLDSVGKEVRFDLKQESDGSLRMLDLLPAFLLLVYSSLDAVTIIDEKDKDIRKSYLQGRMGGVPRLGKELDVNYG